jgi:hypothetical protein
MYYFTFIHLKWHRTYRNSSFGLWEWILPHLFPRNILNFKIIKFTLYWNCLWQFTGYNLLLLWIQGCRLATKKSVLAEIVSDCLKHSDVRCTCKWKSVVMINTNFIISSLESISNIPVLKFLKEIVINISHFRWWHLKLYV